MPNDKPAIRRVTPAQWARSLFIALLPIFAVFLGGATAKWAEGIIVALLGAFLLVQPPRRSLGWRLNLIFLLFGVCALVSFLPQAWFFIPQWRTAMSRDLGIALPSTLSPQPWITAGCFVSLLAGMCWLYRVAAQQLELRVARFQLRLFAGGIVFIAALSILLYLTQHSPSFWINARNFGPFPNRNQTGDLFGVSSVLILAAGQDSIRYRRNTWILWAIALLIVIAAIIIDFSRAGVVLLVAATALWVAGVALRIGSTTRRTALPIALAASFILLLLTALLLTGGATLARFHLQKFAGADPTSDFRWLIFRDAWRMIRSSPWAGVGLGNFEPVFALFRNASRANTRSLHPESDWLWLWAELGWPAILIVITGAALLLRRVLPLQAGTNQRFRLAAVIGALAFAVHGLIDVSGHRVGTAYAAMFLLGLSLHRPSQVQIQKSVLTSGIFRVLGILLLVSGATWTFAARADTMLPGGVGVGNAKQLAAVASRGRNFPETIKLTTEALAWAPLDWELYFLRAAAEVAQGSPAETAIADFRRARVLEPNSYTVPLQEGFAWLHRRPDLAAVAWRDALDRARTARGDVFRSIIYRATLQDPVARKVIEQLALTEHDLALIYFAQLSADEFRPAFTKFFGVDPDLLQLKPEEKRELFQLWDKRGDPAALLEAVNKHPEWIQFAWRPVAKARAAAGDFRGACELMQKYDSETAFPPLQTGQSFEQLRDAVYQRDSLAAGYSLFRQQMQRGQVDDALDTIRHFTNRGAVPAYFHLLEAQAWAASGKWDRAWSAWLAFEKGKNAEF
ncbi:MAG: O-antigen ligase family protein [Verrucomicrobia bacterium]|nr:O-antigen ligase family protein [Verrucomicrobiota bacterium]